MADVTCAGGQLHQHLRSGGLQSADKEGRVKTATRAIYGSPVPDFDCTSATSELLIALAPSDSGLNEADELACLYGASVATALCAVRTGRRPVATARMDLHHERTLADDCSSDLIAKTLHQTQNLFADFK
jgi:hypothetical protein